MTKIIKIGDREIVTHGDKDKSVGPDNRYYLWCQYHEQRRCYGVCTTLLESFEAGRLAGVDAEQTCANAMKRGMCSAETMRRLEVAINASVYFQARMGTADRPYPQDSGLSELSRKTREAQSESFARGWNRVSVPSSKAKEAPEPMAKSQPKLMEGAPSMADAINNAVAKLNENGYNTDIAQQ